MSENSPRWPGRNGSPGLDFSPYRKTDDEKAEPAEVSAKSAAGKSDDTQVSQAAKGPADRGPAHLEPGCQVQFEEKVTGLELA